MQTSPQAGPGLPERLSLPVDIPRSAGTSSDRGRVTFTVDARLHTALTAVVHTTGGSVHAALLAGLAALLTRLGAGTDIPLGASVPGRRDGVIRIGTHEGPGFAQLVRGTSEAMAHPVPDAPPVQVGLALGAPDPRHELAFGFTAQPDGLAGVLDYAADRYETATAQAICDRYVRLLTAAVADPDLSIGMLPVLDPAERQRMLGEWNDTARDVPQVSVPEWFEAQVARTPDAPALILAGGQVSYSDLNARANRLARALIAAGVGPNGVVALLLPRSADLIVALLAVIKAGGTYLPIDPEFPADRIAYLVGDAAPVRILTTAELASLLPDETAARRLLVAGTAGEFPATDIDPVERLAPLTPDCPVYLMYTSGSTGRPKGVTMCAGALVNLLAWHLHDLPTGPGRVTAQFTAITFDISIQEILSTLVTGATLAIPGEDVRRDPPEFAAWLDRYGVTDLFAPNIVIESVCEAAVGQGRKLPALAHVAQAGEALTPSQVVRELFRGRPGRRMHNHYGPTETHAVTSHILEPDVASWPAASPIGRPIWNTRIYLLDDELQLVPPGVPGELYAAGACLARGYHNRPDLTADRFSPDPFGPPGTRMYRTGDLARWRPDGTLDYLGRIDDQVKIRGIRVELGEVESAIRELPGVREVALVVRGDGSKRRMDAYLVPVTEAAADLVEQTRARLRERLPAAMIPASFTLLDIFPLTPNGKIDRRALPDPRELDPVTNTRPLTDQEQRLCRIFAAAVGLDEVGVDQRFFDIGGHSLLAASLIGKVRAEFGVEMSLGDVLRNPSAAELAARVASAACAWPPIVRVQRPDPLPASYAQQRLWIVDQFEGPSAKYNEPLVLRCTGPIDAPAMRAALRDVVTRHESLRTTIDLDPGTGEPCQRVRQSADPALTEIDVTVADLPGRLVDDARRPFDLGADLPVRGTLYHVGADEHVLLIVMHHIACDGLSVAPVANDLATAYNARRASECPQWSPLPVQYADYALWQRQLFDDPAYSGSMRAQAEFWAAALRDVPDLSPLPTDRPRTSFRDGQGSRVGLAIDPELHAQIVAYARARQSTPFMVFHAALVATLARLGAGDDIVIGAAVSGRGDEALDGLAGFFVNTIALRTDASGDPAFEHLLERVRTADLAAFAHQGLPFEQVVNLVNPPRSMAHDPLVQIMLAFQVEQTEPPRMAGMCTAFEPFDLGIAKFDLCFEVVERFTADGAPDGVAGHLGYATDIFDRRTVRDLVEHLVLVLRAAAGRPEHTVLPALPPDDVKERTCHHQGRSPAA